MMLTDDTYKTAMLALKSCSKAALDEARKARELAEMFNDKRAAEAMCRIAEQYEVAAMKFDAASFELFDKQG